jgi:hypothetical protein
VTVPRCVTQTLLAALHVLLLRDVLLLTARRGQLGFIGVSCVILRDRNPALSISVRIVERLDELVSSQRNR